MLNFSYTNVFDNIIGNNNFWRDQSRIFDTLGITRAFDSHTGCVNTIQWDNSGKYILSGGDDRCVSITDVIDSGDIVFNKRLEPTSTVFCAKFAPYFSNEKIFAGFRCGCVVSVDVDQDHEVHTGGKLFFCHAKPVYDILTLTDEPNSLITLSHDQTVCFWDLRLPHQLGRSASLCSRTCFRDELSRAPSAFSTLPLLAPKLNFSFPVTAGDIHPLDGSRSIALASADGFVRLFDLRQLFARSESADAIGESAVPNPYRVVRPLNLTSPTSFPLQNRMNYGRLFITSVKFEPVPSVITCSLGPFQHRHSRIPTSTYRPGRHLLVSHMHAPVYLFDLDKDEECIELPPEELISNEQTASDSIAEEPSRPAEAVDVFHPNFLMSMLFIGLMESRRQARADLQSVPSPEVAVSSSTDSESEPSVVESPSPSDSRSEPRDFNTKMFELVSDVLSSYPRARQVSAYPGQFSIRTVIKDACFWGNDYILSGSECGHVLAWSRELGIPVKALKADRVVVNRLQPHPFLPYLAASGIDYTIKLIQPTPIPFNEDEVEKEEDDLVFKARRRSAIAKIITNRNIERTKTMISRGDMLVRNLANIRLGRAARNFLLHLEENRGNADSVEDPEEESQ